MLPPRLRRRRQSRRASAEVEGSWFAQDVSRAAHGVNQALLVLALRLPPEIADVDVECVRRVAEVVAPDALVDERAREDLARVAHEELEQVRLGRRQLEAASVAPGLHRTEVERQIGEPQDGRWI